MPADRCRVRHGENLQRPDLALLTSQVEQHLAERELVRRDVATEEDDRAPVALGKRRARSEARHAKTVARNEAVTDTSAMATT